MTINTDRFISSSDKTFLTNAYPATINCVASPDGQKEAYVIFAGAMGGLGDLMFALKLARILKSEKPDAYTVITVNSNHALKFLQTQEREIPVISSSSIRETDPINACAKKICLGAIVFSNHELKLLANKIKDPTLILLTEYNHNPYSNEKLIPFPYNPNICFTGVGDSTQGVIVDESLVEFSKKELYQKSSKERLRLLASLSSDDVKNAIRGTCKSFDEYDENNSLYFAYCNQHELLPEFINFLCEKTKNADKKNINIYCAKHLCWWNQTNFSTLDRHGISKVMYNHKLLYENKDSPNGKTVNILTLQTSPLSHEDFIILLKASEKECLVTGDQSLLEAIALDKDFIYETLDHKQTLSNALQEEFKKIDPALIFNKSRWCFSFSKSSYPLRELYCKFNKKIIEDFNLKTKLFNFIDFESKIQQLKASDFDDPSFPETTSLSRWELFVRFFFRNNDKEEDVCHVFNRLLGEKEAVPKKEAGLLLNYATHKKFFKLAAILIENWSTKDCVIGKV